MNNILIIDDRMDFVSQFVDDAKIRGFKVAHGKSFESLKKLMPNLVNKISVVILDIKCLLTDDQEVEDKAFIAQALSFLDTNYQKFPRVILTGDDTEYKNIKGYFSNENVYLKTPTGMDAMYEKIKYYSDNSDDLKIKREYIEVFSIFEEGLLTHTQETQVLNILKDINEKVPSSFKGIITNIRSVQEMIYKEINQKNKDVVPDDMIRGGMVQFNKLMDYLGGKYGTSSTNTYQNATIFNLSNSLYWSCGEYIHEEVNRSYMISNMALKSLIYNLLELLIWSKQYLK